MKEKTNEEKKFITWAGYSILVLVFSLILCASLFQIDDPDIPQYLANGRYILQHGFTHACAFSYATSSCQIPYSEWLAHVFIFAVHSLAGWNGLVTFQILLVLAIFVAIYIYSKKKNYHPLVILTLMIPTTFVAMERFMLRADLIALLVAVVFYCLLDLNLKKIENQKLFSKEFFWLLILQILWTNIHGSFPLGWLVVAAFLLERSANDFFSWQKGRQKFQASRQLKFLLVLLPACVLASFINPYGLSAFLWPFKFYFGPAAFHSQLEFLSPLSPTDYLRLSARVYKYLLWLTLGLLIAGWKKIRIADIFILSAFFYLSLHATRYLALLAVFAALILPRYLTEVLEIVPSRLKRKIALEKFLLPAATLAVLGVLIIIIITDRQVITNKFYVHDQRPRRFGFGLSETAYPAGAAQFVASHNLSGTMFNDYGSGGFLNWKFYPKKTFIDGHSYTLESLNYYENILSGKISFMDAATKFDIGYAVLNYTNEDVRPLAVNLYKNPAWALVYADENSLVFVANNQQNSELIRQNKIDFASGQNFNPDSLPDYKLKSNFSMGFLNRALLLDNLGLPALAKHQLELAVTSSPHDDYVAWTDLGAAEFELNNANAAVEDYKKALLIEQSYAPTHFDLALALAQLDRLTEATTEFQKALALNKSYKPQADKYLAQINQAIQTNNQQFTTDGQIEQRMNEILK